MLLVFFFCFRCLKYIRLATFLLEFQYTYLSRNSPEGVILEIFDRTKCTTQNTKNTFYSLNIYFNAGPWQQLELTELPLQYATLIEDLRPATKYAFRVIAEGPAGKSIPSAELIIRTEPQRPAGPPLNLSVRATSSTEVVVTWSPPLVDLRHGDIQGYNIGYRIGNAGAYNFTTVPGDGEDGGGEYLMGGLAKYTRYTIVVQAFNEVGTGPLTEPVSVQTLEDGKYYCPLGCTR